MFIKPKKILLLFLALSTVISAASISASAADITVTTQPADATVFAGDTVTLTVKAKGSGTLKYQWYKNTKDSASNGTQISGAASASYIPSTSSTGTTYYYCVIYTTGSSVSSITSAVATVTVKAGLDMTEQPSDMTVYVGGSATLSVKATGSGTLSYQWYSNTTKSITGATTISGATDKEYKVPTASVGTLYYYCVVTVTDSGMTGKKTVTATSDIAKVIVKELSNAPAITSQPSGVTVYTDAAARFTISAVGNGTLSYQWYSNATKSTAGATAIAGATGTTYAAPTDTEGTHYYYCVVTNTVASASGPETYTTTSNIVACVIKPGTVIIQEPFDTTAYIGETVTLYVGATGSGTLAYQWYSNSKNSTSGSSKISGATEASYSPPTAATGTVYYFCIVKSTDSAVAGGASSITSYLAKVVVLAKSASAPTITKQPSSISVYTGSAAALSVGATGTGTLSYQWYSNSENSAAGGTKISGATEAKYSAPTQTVGTSYYYCEITNTADTADGTKTMTAVSSPAGVSVKAPPSITTQPAAATVFAGETVTLTVAATGSGTLTYQWFYNTSSSASEGLKISGATSSTYTFQPQKVGTRYYYCVVTNTDSTITGTGTATVTSGIAAVVAKSRDASAPTITKKPVSLTVALGDEATLTITASGSGTLSYQWYSNSISSTQGASAISGATDSAYTTTPTAASTKYYYCVVTNEDSKMPGNNNASVTSSIVSITAKEMAPVISQQPVSSSSFQGGILNLTVMATGTGALRYQWYSNVQNSNTSGTAIPGATRSTYLVPTASAGTVYYYCVVTNTLKKTSGTATGSAASKVAAVTVKASAVITKQPTDAVLNSGQAFTLSVEATCGGSLSYQWYSNTKAKSSGGTAINGATGATYRVSTQASTQTTTTYYYCIVTGRASGISTATAATSDTAAITLKAVNAPAPKITRQPTKQTIILGDSATLTVEATGSGTLSYQWYSNSKGTIAGATEISGATGKSYTALPATAGVTYYYCIVTNMDSTMSGSPTASVTSNQVAVTTKALTPTIQQQSASSAVYTGNKFSISVNASGSGKLTYQWYSSTEARNDSGTAITGASSAAYTVPTNTEGTVYYYCVVVNTLGTLTGTAVSNAIAVTVKAGPCITRQPESVTIKSGERFSLSVEASATGTLSYQWYSNTKNKNSGGVLIKGATSATYVTTTTVSATKVTYYYCVVTSQDSGIANGKAATITSSPAAVTVNKPA